MKCYECNGEVIKKKVEFSMYGIKLGLFPAEVCKKWEEVFDSKTMETMEQKAKAKGIWGLGKKSKVIMAGNSIAVRIPKKIAEFLKLKPGKETFVHPDNKRLVIETG